DQAVAEIKEAFSEAPLLARYDPSKRLLLQTDSSKSALGAVISHYTVDADGKRHEQPIYFASKTMNPHQKN
ncbi:unnamed protein product, partial [Heterosigma akashiwo]